MRFVQNARIADLLEGRPAGKEGRVRLVENFLGTLDYNLNNAEKGCPKREWNRF